MINPTPLVATKLNLDKHYTLLSEGEITYLLNGDIEGYEANNQNFFVQNQLSNELCLQLEFNEFVGPGISVGNNEHVFFIKSTPENPEFPNCQILLANLDNCSYEVLASGDCLGFDVDYPIRGVYKYNSQENSRTIYFVDGLNPNRYFHIDKPFPQINEANICETCEDVFNGELNCEALNINKVIDIPCTNLDFNKFGTLQSGVYQIGFAWSDSGIILSDFYFSDVIKVWSEKNEIGLELSVECVDTTIFNAYTLVLVSNTKENGTVVYRLGEYQFPTTHVTVNSLNNLSVVDLSVATQKKIVYDNSQHITTNGETLLLGGSQTTNIISYQPQASGIEVGWVEIKVPKEDAYKYQTFMRDEVYELNIEWFHTNGQSLGEFHIPGRACDNVYSYNPGTPNIDYGECDAVPSGFDIYAQLDCLDDVVSAWQITNTAYIEGDFNGNCVGCVSGTNLGLYGRMGYYECNDFTYPDHPEIWGELSCQKIRRHKMPSHNLTHIYQEGGCTPFEFPLFPFGSVTADVWLEADCVNLLGLRLINIPYPRDKEGNPIPNVLGFRILYAKREGNKSVLHKGLIFNMGQEVVETGSNQELILYPNYPFNDQKEDVYLGKEQSLPDPNPYTHEGADNYTELQWTYHSPDILFKESSNEFGSELRVYTAEIGGIFGDISKVYKHPEQSPSKNDGQVGSSNLFNYANSVNLVGNFSDYDTPQLDFYQSWRIEQSQFLLPIKQFVGNQKVNNLYREESYYVDLAEQNSSVKYIPSAFFMGNQDTSRVLASELVPNTNLDDITINYCTVINRDSTDYDIQAVSCYSGIKVRQPNQYGEAYSNIYIPVDSCIIPVTFGEDITDTIIQGGDIYITRHSVLRKMPLFTEWLFDVPFDTLIDYRDKRNVWFPQFWWNNLTVSFTVDARLDNLDYTLPFFESTRTGRFYVHVNGNAYFWCESEFIGDYRERDIRDQTQFYPKQSVKELTRSDRFKDQQIWLYDFSLLNNSIDQSALSSQVAMLNSLDPDYNLGHFIVHYPLKDDPQSGVDKWLSFPPLNYTILPRIYGQFTGMHFIDQYSILFEFENGTLHSQEDYTLTINQGNSLFLAQGDIFSRRLRKFANESTGYTGSVDPFFPLNTRYGLVFYDRYRRTFFQWTNQLEPIADLKSFLHSFSEKINPSYRNSMISVYDNMTDKVYITDKITGWTISFSPKIKGFISFHSFVPDWYVPHNETFFSIFNNGLWRHNSETEGYQTYYGTKYPFEVEFVIKNQRDTRLQDLSLFTDYLDYGSYNSLTQRPDKFFNKAFIYNNRYSTGLLDLRLKDINNPNNSLIQNKETAGIAEVTQVMENIYRINKLENNQVDSPNIVYNSDGVTYSLLNINQNRPPHQREKLTGRWFKAHLIDDENDTSKILVQLNLSQTDETKR